METLSIIWNSLLVLAIISGIAVFALLQNREWRGKRNIWIFSGTGAVSILLLILVPHPTPVFLAAEVSRPVGE